MEKKNKEKVLLGMSGGVDSSVTAHILKKQGYDVIGAYMQLWAKEPNKDAKEVTEKLGIPFYIFDMQKQFKQYVINYFISEYQNGRTPNPCVACNRYIKFGALLDKANELGIEYLATGHYARIEEVDNRYLLKKARDETKDQTYFLYTLNQTQLSKSIFPLGEYKKKKIREIAKEIGLEVSSKPDSQEICFIKDNDHYSFIQEYGSQKEKKGDIIDKQVNILGYHDGLSKFTIGQRRGLGVITGKPMYVVDLEANTNRVVLGSNRDLFEKELVANTLNWISIDRLEKSLKVKAKIRSQATQSDCTITPIDKKSVRVTFDKPQRAITKGQSIVFYDNDYVLGGGVIS